MFTKDCKPFKIVCYQKNFDSKEIREDLVKSYTCIYYQFITMVGSCFNNELVFMKKDKFGRIYVGDDVLPHIEYNYTLHEFLENFIESEALDFVILKCPVMVLITRNEKNINVFTTTSNNYLDTFANPSNFFNFELGEQLYYNEPFSIELLGSRYVNDDDISESMESSTGESDDIHKNDDLLESGEKIIMKSDDNESKDSKKDISKMLNDISLATDDDDKFVIELSQPIDLAHFEKNLKPESKTINLGKIMENGKVDFKKFIIEDSSNEFLQKIVDVFPASIYDYVEIVGKSKIAGCIDKNGKVLWFSESLDLDGDKAEYIKALNMLFFMQIENEVLEAEDEVSSSEEKDY